jgi:hypothetical protein
MAAPVVRWEGRNTNPLVTEREREKEREFTCGEATHHWVRDEVNK